MNQLVLYGINLLNKIVIPCCCIFLLTVNSRDLKAQKFNYEWARSMGGTGADEGKGVAVDQNGNVYVVGYKSNANFEPGSDMITHEGGRDVFLVKYNAIGEFQWAKSIGGFVADQGQGVAIDKSGNVYISGTINYIAYIHHDNGTDTFRTLGGPDVFFAKYDSSGNYLWAKSIEGPGIDMEGKISLDGSGNVYITGSFSSDGMYFRHNAGIDTLTSEGGDDVFVAKYDPNGNYLWSQSLGSSNTDAIGDVAVDDNDNVYITGYYFGSRQADAYIRYNTGIDTLKSEGNNDIFLVKYDSDGLYQWAKSIGGSGPDRGMDIAIDGMNNVYVTGYFSSDGIYFHHNTGTDTITSEGGDDVFVVKYDSNGQYQWSNSLGGASTDQGRGVTVDGDGNVYVTGYFRVAFGSYIRHSAGTDTLISEGGDDVFVIKYDPSGNYQWSKSLGGPNADQSHAIVSDNNRNVYVTGYFSVAGAYIHYDTGTDTLTSVGGNDGFVLKISQECQIYNDDVASACDSYTYNGTIYTNSAVIVDTFKSITGCDSIVTFNLTINYTYENPVIKEHYCDSVRINGETYTSTGIYTQYFKSIVGCDSNITYDITIGKTNGDTITEVACDSFVFNDTTYIVTDTYLITFPNASGCDSIVVLDLTVNISPVATVIKSGSTLTASSAEHYQWINCDDNSVITEASDQNYIVTQTGNYAVILTTSDCRDTSDCIFVEIESGINELYAGNQVRLYPNPTDKHATIQTDKPVKNATIRLVNMVGQVLEERTNQHGTLFSLDMHEYAAGVYFVEINEQRKAARMKVVKE